MSSEPLPQPFSSILVLGAGELGTAMLRALHTHINSSTSLSATPSSSSRPKVTVLLRPLSSSSSSNPAQSSLLRSLGTEIRRHDIAALSVEDLAHVFEQYDAIVSCTGFSAGKGTQLKIAKAVILSASRASTVDYVEDGWKKKKTARKAKKRFFPWQFGVDYDAIGYGSGQDLFDEQLDVRALLRSQERESMMTGVDWVIVSTGIFLSFLFVPSFGVVEGIDINVGTNASANSEVEGEGKGLRISDEVVVRGLGDWENKLTVTNVEDIARVTVTALFDPGVRNGVVHVAGDTLTYSRLADVVESVRGKGKVRRELWSREFLKQDLEKELNSIRDGEGKEEGDVVMAKYRVAFSEGKGIAWVLEGTYNAKMGVRTVSVERWLRDRARVKI